MPTSPHSGIEPAPGRDASEVLHPDDVYFPREFGHLLTELARAIQKHAMYPPAHPALKPAVDAATAALEELLAGRAELTLEVGRNQFAIEGSQSDPGNPVFHSFAGLLHRHQVAAISFVQGFKNREMGDFLAVVSREPERTGQPLGLHESQGEKGWPHIRIHPLRYEELEMARAEESPRHEEPNHRSAALWRDLASAALRKPEAGNGPIAGLSEEGPAKGGTDLEGLARAVERRSEERTYAARFVNQFAGLSRELRERHGTNPEELQQRASRLISLIRPETLERILELGTDLAEKKELVADAASWMDSDSMLKLVRAAATRRKDISHWYLLMMVKMARYADSDARELHREGETRLRELVDDLFTEWSADDVMPEGYSSALEQAAVNGNAKPGNGKPVEEVRPERILQMSVELDKTGGRLVAAARKLVRERRFKELFEILDAAPSPNAAAEMAVETIATPETVMWILEAPEPEFDALDRVIQHVGIDAVPPMLEVLANSARRPVRRHLFTRISALGSRVGRYVLPYLEDERWFVRRNMLALMDELESWPTRWSPFDHTKDPHTAVRREALKMLLRIRSQHDYAVRELLEETDHRSLALGLAAAMQEAPLEVVPQLIHLVEDQALGEELRGMAIRALAPLQTPEVPKTLVHLVFLESGWLRRLLGLRKLKPTSPLLLEGLAGLARHWHRDPGVQRLLKRAARAEDRRVRDAARGRAER